MDWKLVAVTFGTLFLAELGDKTQLAVFTLSADSQKPWPVFLGASSALIVVTLLGAFFGGLVTKYIPAHLLQLIAGLLFVGIGVIALCEALPAFIRSISK